LKQPFLGKGRPPTLKTVYLLNYESYICEICQDVFDMSKVYAQIISGKFMLYSIIIWGLQNFKNSFLKNYLS